MIATKQKSFEDILKFLEGKQKVFLMGCGECATTCKTGGEPELLEMKDKLEKHGKTVTGWFVPKAPCVSAQVKAAVAKKLKEVKECDSILVFACGSGIQTVKENDRYGKAIHPGCDTIFVASVDPAGNFYEYCSACGECVLDETGGICPVTRCAKGLLNGPCGGNKEGKCEVDRNKDCAWIKIYENLKKTGKLDLMHNIHLPKDFAKTTKPHNIMFSK